MFQQYLDVGPTSSRIYGVLYPTGRMNDPWEVRCITCPYTAMADNHRQAVHVALIHDRQHDADNERNP